MYVYECEIPFALGLLDKTVQTMVHEDGAPRTLLEVDSKAAYE
jgi:hypothetical protein